jgi:hypothetical protein
MSDGMSEGARHEREGRNIRDKRRAACRVLLARLGADSEEASCVCFVSLAGAVKILLGLADDGRAEERAATLCDDDESSWQNVLDAACRALPTLLAAGEPTAVTAGLQAGDHGAWARLLIETGDREIFDAEARQTCQELSPFAGQVLLVIVRERFSSSRPWSSVDVKGDAAAYLERLADRDGCRIVVAKAETYPAEQHTLLVMPPIG